MNDDATLQHVTSADGTTLAYERHGDGPAVVLIGGAAVDRRANAEPTAPRDAVSARERRVISGTVRETSGAEPEAEEIAA
jgi:hypothetical protein